MLMLPNGNPNPTYFCDCHFVNQVQNCLSKNKNARLPYNIQDGMVDYIEPCFFFTIILNQWSVQNRFYTLGLNTKQKQIIVHNYFPIVPQLPTDCKKKDSIFSSYTLETRFPLSALPPAFLQAWDTPVRHVGRNFHYIPVVWKEPCVGREVGIKSVRETFSKLNSIYFTMVSCYEW